VAERRERAAPPLLAAAQRLRRAVRDYPGLAPLGAAEYVLDPLDYAWTHHRAYVTRYGPTRPGQVEAVLVGMNPGPWGMAQTGVPFGSPDLVAEFLGISGPVTPPARTHPKRPIVGFAGTRGEVSGQRLWGGVRACFGTPEAFFDRFFVANYCPLAFQSASGANLTPDKLPAAELRACLLACDDHLEEVLRRAAPRTAIGVGKWAETQLRRLVAERGVDVEVRALLHPSPASPAANRGWLEQARAQLEDMGHAWPAPRASG